MKINILKPLGNVGIISLNKEFISDSYITITIEGEAEGTLSVISPIKSFGTRVYAVHNGTCKISEYEISLGTSKIVFSNDDGDYDCGEIIRNGRFLEVNNHADKLIISCAIGLAAQAEEIGKLKEENRLIKEQYGIKII